MIIPYIRKSATVLVLVILAWSLAFFISSAIEQEKQNIKNLPQLQHLEVVDSTWYTSPGEENSMQVDYIYYCRTKTGWVLKTKSKAFEAGDTILIEQ